MSDGRDLLAPLQDIPPRDVRTGDWLNVGPAGWKRVSEAWHSDNGNAWALLEGMWYPIAMSAGSLVRIQRQ